MTLCNRNVEAGLPGVRTRAIVGAKAWVRTVCEQVANHAGKAPIGRAVERRQPVASPAIHIGSMLQQQTNQVEHGLLPIAGIRYVGRSNRAPERADLKKAVAHDSVRVRSTIEQYAGNRKLAPVAGSVERSAAPHIDSACGIRGGIKRRFNTIEHSQFGRSENIQRDASLKQQFYQGGVSCEVRGVDRLRAEHIRRGRERRVFVQQGRDAIAIALSGGGDDPVNVVHAGPG